MRVIVTFLILLLGAPLQAAAQSYPNRPVRLISPNPAGGANDVIGRIVAHKIGEILGQQMVVDNRGGAGGTIGTEMAARAAPDGYTLFAASQSTVTVAPHIYSKLSYDVLRDFAPIANFVEVQNLLNANPAFPPNTVKELVALAKSRQGKFHFASGGVGTGLHMAGELLNLAAGIKMIHVPYKGAAPSMTALMSGEVDTMFNGVSSALPHVKAGRLRAIAISSAQRSPLLPDLPTVAESGLRYETSGWYGLVAPTGTPKPVTARLQASLHKALNAPEMKERLAAQGIEGIASTPEQLTQHLRGELDKWTAVVKAAGLKAD